MKSKFIISIILNLIALLILPIFVSADADILGNTTVQNLTSSGNINAVHNITATLFIGNGSLLTGIVATVIGNDVIGDDELNYSLVTLADFTNDVGYVTNATMNHSVNWSNVDNKPTNLDIDSTDDITTSGGTINGDLLVNGAFTVIGSILNATVTNQYINGSFYPSLSGIFNIGSVAYKFNEIHANYINASINWNNVSNKPANLDIDSTNDLITTTSFGGDVTGTYDAIVITESHTPSVNMTTTFGGEVSGTYDAITVSDHALDDIYFKHISNFTGALTDTKYCIYDSANGLINCTADGGSTSSIPSVNLTTNFGGDVSGTYDSLTVHIPSVNISNQNITGNFTVTGNILTEGYIYGDGSHIANLPAGSTPSVNITTIFGGDVSGTYDSLTVHIPSVNISNQNITGNFTVTGAIAASAYYGDGSHLTGVTASTPSVNITTIFGGDVSGTYDDLTVLEAHTPSVNLTTDFGGEISGSYSAITISQEAVQDDVGAMANNGDGTTMTYDDGGNTLTVDIMSCYATQIIQYDGADWQCANAPSSSVPSINMTTNFGGDVSGTYDDLTVLESHTPSVNMTTNFGGNVSGTYNNIVVHIPSLNNTGTMTDTKWCVWDDTSKEIDCNVDPVSDTYNTTQQMIDAVNNTAINLANAYGFTISVHSVNMTTNFGGDVSGTYNALTVTEAHTPSVNLTTSFGGDVSGTYDNIILNWLTSDYFNQNLNTTNDVTFNNVTTTSGITVGGQIQMNNQNITNIECITFNSGGKICSG